MAIALQTDSIGVRDGSVREAFRCVGCGLRRPGLGPILRAEPESRPFDLARCPGCGLVQQHPRAPADRLAAQHDRSYYVFNESESLRWSRAVQQYIVHILPRESHRAQRLLDIGCGPGHFAALARSRGWRVTAMDIAPDAVSRAAVRFGLDVRAGSLTQYRSTLPPFDLIFLGDVIEHVSEPIRFLEDVRAVLSPHGLLCIDTPNWNSRWRLFGRSRWLGLNRFHVNLFDAGALTALLEDRGFRDIHTGSYTHYRYESLTVRPEPQAWVHRLPAFLAWRVNRFLAGAARVGFWASLLQNPPSTLADARTRVDALSDRGRPDTSQSTADNLIATARRD